LLYVVPPYVGGPEPAPVDFETVEEGKRELAALQKTITGVIPSRTQVLLGVAHVEITEAAAKLGADLIIISTHGHTGVTRILLGSTAEKVVRHAPCPVLIVRECEREFVPAS
jgi:nucleotide-binding universal stress UspA family protein